MELIDKSALVTEIEKCYNECLKRARITDSYYWNIKADAYRNVLAILNDTLEVKEVDLEKEIESYYFHQCDLSWCKDLYSLTYIRDTLSKIAKYFFELGLKVQK